MSDDVIRIEIPGEPKGVGRVKARNGPLHARVYTPTATRTEAGVIRMYAEKAMAGRPPLEGPIDIRISLFMSIPKSMSKRNRALALADPPQLKPTRKPDWDNCSKFSDQFNKLVWLDDAQVTDAHIYKRYAERPVVVFEIRRA